MRRHDWFPDIERSDVPIYIAVSEAISDDISDGRLRPGDLLPTQRSLAKRLNLDVTTVARGYAEAVRRGLIESRVGSGTYVRGRSDASNLIHKPDVADRSMNQPPDLTDSQLILAVRESFVELSEQLPAILRYQPSGGSTRDRAAGIRWLSNRGIEIDSDTIHVTAGTHCTLNAILANVGTPNDVIACEQITYSGILEIATSMRRPLVGLPGDEDGIDPQALDQAAQKQKVRLLYLNPTLRNPTTDTIPAKRRAEIVHVARKHGIAIIEDDAYGMLPVGGPPAFAMLAPEITFYIAGLAKCLGPGLRIAYLVMPRGQRTSKVLSSLRAVTVMASPLTSSLATQWIETGLADSILSSVRSATRARQKLLRHLIPQQYVRTAEYAFHAWVTLPAPWTRARIVDWMRGYSLGAVASDRFCVGLPPPEAIRLCLGGAARIEETEIALQALVDAFESPPSMI